MSKEASRGDERHPAHLWIRNNILGLVAIFIALSGSAVATQVARDYSVKKVVTIAAKGKKRGPAGPQGPAGPAGSQGAPGSPGAAGNDGSPDTGAQILAKLDPVDGSGSGLDADSLDGQSSTAFMPNGPPSNDKTMDFPSTAAQTCTELTGGLVGAIVGMPVALAVPPVSASANTIFMAYISASDFVTVRFCNLSAAPVDPTIGSFRFRALPF
jgi:hypothetical protein